ncbi:hypothetical protein ATERTT37_006714 [Aspergillus terreus]
MAIFAKASSAGFVGFVNGAAGIAKRVCKIEGSEKCEEYADLVADGFNLIWVGGQAIKHGAAGVSTAQERINSVPGARRSVVNEDYTSRILEGLSELKARDDELALVNRIVLRNLTSPKNQRGHDVAIHHYDDGVGQIHLPFDGQSMGGSDDLLKRFDGEGFKIAFTSRASSTPDRTTEAAISNAIAQNWAREADANINELIGFVKTDNKANFYWRIIPETQRFGTNYESVDVCGGMASYLTL